MMGAKRAKALTGVLIFSGLLLAACAAPGVATPTGGGVYHIGIFEDITTTNYVKALGPDSTAYNFYVLGGFYPSLYGYSDQRFDWVPGIAADFPSDLEKEGDFYVTEVTLKQGVEWSDGEEITAEDVVFTANMALDLQLTGNWAANYDPTILDRVEAIDDYTVKFYFLEEPGLARWQFGAAMGPILAEHYWAPVVEEASAPLEGVDPSDEETYAAALEEARANLYAHVPEDEPSAGGFIFDTWEPGAFVSTARNPNYYSTGTVITEYANGTYQEILEGEYEFTAYGDPTGEVVLEYQVGPYTPSVIYSIYGSQDAAILALKDGEIDIMLSALGLEPGLRDQIIDHPGIASVTNASNGFRYLSFNTRRPPMDSKEFRQAVAILIDKEFVTDTLLQGTAIPVYTLVAEGNAFWYNPDVPEYGKGMNREERIEAVIELLTEAGFSWESEPRWDPDEKAVIPGTGLTMPNGEPVPELEILAPSPGYDPMRSTFAIWIETWLNEAGIPAKAKLTGFNTIIEKAVSEQDFDVYILGWSVTLFPDYLRDFFHSENAEPGGFNAGGYSNPEFDALSQQLVTTTDLEEAREIAFELQEVLAEELPYIVLYNSPLIEVWNGETLTFPYTEVLDGIQRAGGMPSSVVVAE